MAGVFLTLMITSGLGFYNAAVILEASKDELDASVAAVSGATALFFGVSGITSFLLARKMAVVDLRWFYIAGGVTGWLALTSLRYVESVVGLYLFFAVFGTGFALAGLVPATTVIARWFSVRRSVALSIGTTGLSMGGIVITPVAARLIDDRGLADSGPWFGIAWIVGVITVALLLIRSDPADLGLEPDGATPADRDGQPPPSVVGATFEEAVATRFFRFLAASYALIFLAQVGAMAQLFNLATERVDRGTATTALSALAFASIGGRLVGGVVVTRVPAKPLTAVLTVVQGLALVFLAFAGSRLGLIGSAMLLGLSVGNLLMLQPLLLAETFGVRDYSRIYSFSQLFGTIGVAGGPFVIGALHDLTDYRAAFLIASLGNVVGLVFLALAGPVDEARASWSASPTGTAVT